MDMSPNLFWAYLAGRTSTLADAYAKDPAFFERHIERPPLERGECIALIDLMQLLWKHREVAPCFQEGAEKAFEAVFTGLALDDDAAPLSDREVEALRTVARLHPDRRDFLNRVFQTFAETLATRPIGPCRTLRRLVVFFNVVPLEEMHCIRLKKDSVQ